MVRGLSFSGGLRSGAAACKALNGTLSTQVELGIRSVGSLIRYWMHLISGWCWWKGIGFACLRSWKAEGS